MISHQRQNILPATVISGAGTTVSPWIFCVGHPFTPIVEAPVLAITIVDQGAPPLAGTFGVLPRCSGDAGATSYNLWDVAAGTFGTATTHAIALDTKDPPGASLVINAGLLPYLQVDLVAAGLTVNAIVRVDLYFTYAT